MRTGFSLVELSIVLVILGLLTGGILTGQNLIRAAELRSVPTELAAYQAAIMTFRDKYFYLPGDMPNATDFWGAMTNCGAASPSGTGTQTCNGNGNGIVLTSTASRTGEVFGFWQQLANAGMIEGSYNGIAGSGSADHAILGTNVPRSKINSAGWFAHSAASSYSAYYFDSWSNIRNYFAYGIETADHRPMAPVFKNDELWNVDTKLDDGLPTSGKVQAMYRAGCTDASSKTDISGTVYALDNDELICAALFLNAF